MLPVTYYERISTAYGLRTTLQPQERRRAIRADFRWPGGMYDIRGRFIGRETAVRIREMSRGGCSLVIGKKMAVGDMFLLRFAMRDQGTYWFWCKIRRVTEKDRITNVVGCEFMRVLYPGQEMGPEIDLARALWLKVDGDSDPQDPILQMMAGRSN